MSAKKIIRLAILILIPALITFFIGSYGYDYYSGRTQIKEDYYEDVENNTHAQLQAFMKYNEYKYEKTPVFTQDVKDASGEATLLKLEIYRAVYEVINEDTPELKARYIFVLYDVNTDLILKEVVGSDDVKGFNKPILTIKCMPIAEDYTESDAVEPFTLSTTAARTIDGVFGIVDYVASEVNGKNMDEIDPLTSSTYTGAYYARWNIETNYDREYKELFKLQLGAYATDKEDSSDDAKRQKVLFEETSTVKEENGKEVLDEDQIKIDLDASSWDIDAMEKGYNNDEVKAGYFGWVFTHYLWWICLIALAVSFFLTYTFVAVWEYDDTNVNNKKRK